MADFGGFLRTLKDDVKVLIASEYEDFRSEAEADVGDYIELLKSDLERWTKLLAAGQLTKGEFQFLIKARRDQAKLQALTAAGLAHVTLDKFRTALTDTVVGAAMKTFL